MNFHSISSPLKLGGPIITDFMNLKKEKMKEELKYFWGYKLDILPPRIAS
jgi:hypothetical protein